MPFVSVVYNTHFGSSRPETSERVAVLERLCKEVWVSMNRGQKKDLKETDIGGVCAPAKRGFDPSWNQLKVDFHYVERDEEFDLELWEKLKKVICDAGFNRSEFQVDTWPSPSDRWFEDPTWAIKEVSK